MLGVGLDGHWYSGSVARKASEAIGRPVVIEGNLDIDWTWPPLIRAEQVRVANAPWSKVPFMLEISRLACRIDLQALLRGRLVLPMIELVEPVIRLETSEQGEANWTVHPTQTVADKRAPGTGIGNPSPFSRESFPPTACVPPCPPAA
jgi:uncharacterized protein involved in outer membrane biogenesis